MNWLKKLFKTTDDEYIEEVELEEEVVEKRFKQSKIPFRFPLISDEEKQEILHGRPSEYKREIPAMEKERERDPFYERETVFPAPPRKREILHGRPSEFKREIQSFKKEPERDSFYERETIFPAPPRKRETVIPIQPKTTYQQPILKKEPEIRPVIKKRPFTPTEVPSPIYGFKRPTQGEDQMKDLGEVKSARHSFDIPSLREKVEVKPMEAKGSFEANKEEVSAEIAAAPVEYQEETKAEKVIEPVEYHQEETKAETVTEPVVSNQEETKTEKVIEPVEYHQEETKVEKVIEPVEYHQEEIKTEKVIVPVKTYQAQYMQKDPGMEEVAVSQVEELTAEKAALEVKQEEPKKKENIRPFNVLMLKSDKEKLNKLENSRKILEPISTGILNNPVTTPLSKLPGMEKIEQEPEDVHYQKPSFSYLLPPEKKDEDKEWMEEQANKLVEALSYFQVTGEIIQVVQGPAVTQFELTVGHGTKVSKIRNLSDDLKLALAAKDIRIQAPIPGKSSIGIEIPNRRSRAVRISEVLDTETFKQSDSPLEAALGLDLTGKPLTLDLRKMPHGLIAGATGSGKSVFINSLLISLLYKATPEELKLMLIDPKMVELAPYNHIPHLVSPVITDVKAATAALKWAVDEMERRYQLFAHVGVRDISRYNTLATEKRQYAQKLPYLVIVIDELADLMMMAPTDVEDAICRIAQKARACGIHLVLATQRPSVDVITGLIKANVPTRVAFSVSSQIDSRTILDQQGAERLLGKGDMLYQGNGMSSPIRVQGTYVSDEEIERIIEYARTQGAPEYLFEQEELLQKAEVAEQDDLFEEACRFVVEQGSASTSLLQRKFHLGYNRAARLITAMEECGYISEQRGSKAREVILTNEKLDEIFS